MKRKIVLGLSLISSIYALTIPTTMTTVANNVTTMLKICSITSTQDASAQAAYQADPTKCFNAYDIPFTSSTGAIVSPVSLGTKTAGKDFIFKIEKKPTCAVNNVTYSLVDKKTGNVIPNTTQTITNPLDEQVAKFNVPNSYKDVEVQFSYTKTTVSPSATKIEVTCPTSATDYTIVNSEDDIPVQAGIFAVPQEECYTFTFSNLNGYEKQAVSCENKNPTIITEFPTKPSTSATYAIINGYKCYKYPTTTSSTKTEYSTDDFAIKPDKFNITLKKSPIKVGAVEPMELNVVNTNNDITTNYANSSVNLAVEVNPSDAQATYAFNIYKGVLNRSSLSFLKPKDDIYLTVTDTNYAAVDADDTAQNCRNITGTSNKINVIDASKYWAGTGTNEPENNPAKNNVNSEIKQNVKKDIHFQKMGW